MIEHIYKGRTFLIKDDEPPSKWDGYCQFLLDYTSRFHVDQSGSVHPPSNAVKLKPKSVSRSKPLKGTNKVIPHVEPINALGGRTEAVETMLADSSTDVQQESTPKSTHESFDTTSDQYYADGNYRKPCRRCGKPMKRTGRRGRAPVTHLEGECS